MRKWKSILLAVVMLLVLNTPVKAEQDPFTNPVILRCTCYLDTGTTASGCQTRPNIMAAKKEWIGCVAEVNAINEDGSVGEFIGFFEILDTGYGRETGYGESKILKGKTLGTIETGETVDIWQPTLDAAQDWVKKYGDYVYVKIIKGNG